MTTRGTSVQVMAIAVLAPLILTGIAGGEERLEELKAQFEELRGDLNSPRVKFEEKYAGELAELRKRALAAADLELAVEVEKEAKAFAGRVGAPEYSDSPELERLQRIYVEQVERIAKERERAASGLFLGYIKSLEGLREELTKASKIDEAVEVQAELRRVEALAKVVDPGAPGTTRLTGVDPRSLVDGTGKPARVYRDLEIMTYPWGFRNPSYIQMEKVGDELLTLAHIQGKMAGGGEVVTFGKEGKDSLGFVVRSAQSSLAATAYALRDPRLRMGAATVRFTSIKAGEPRKRLIHQSRGFCYLGGIWGWWGNDARCDVSIDPVDGYYYLSGYFSNSSTGAKAISVEYPEGEGPRYEVDKATWRRGNPARELIAAEDGICLLSGLSGAFEGGGEIVRVVVDDAGKWQLRCQSAQPNTGARVLVLKMRR